MEIDRAEYLRLRMDAYSARQRVKDLGEQMEWLVGDVNFWKSESRLNEKVADYWEDMYYRMRDGV